MKVLYGMSECSDRTLYCGQGDVGPLGLSGQDGPWGAIGENGIQGPKGEKGHVGLMVRT